jgi:PadR family transcriptional regulator, regulatory protein PadR
MFNLQTSSWGEFFQIETSSCLTCFTFGSHSIFSPVEQDTNIDLLWEQPFWDQLLDIENLLNVFVEKLCHLKKPENVDSPPLDKQLSDIGDQLDSLVERLVNIESSIASDCITSFVTDLLEKMVNVERELVFLRKRVLGCVDVYCIQIPYRGFPYMNVTLNGLSIGNISAIKVLPMMVVKRGRKIVTVSTKLTTRLERIWLSACGKLASTFSEISIMSDVLQPLVIPRGAKDDSIFKISPKEELLLLVLYQKELYGLQIQQAVKESSGGLRQIRIGSLYPMLHGLETKGHVQSRWGDETHDDRGGARRRYYKLTAAGNAAVEFIQSFHRNLLNWKAEEL